MAQPEPLVKDDLVATRLPRALADAIAGFLLDKRPGNVVLNFKDGHMLSFHVEKIHVVKRPV